VIEFVEGMASVGLGAAALHSFNLWRRREKLPANIVSRRAYDYAGDFRCPECNGWVVKSEVKPRCECDEFWEAHRHFECGYCHLEGIVQTRNKPR
jgi:transcription elongation factor Elf1